MKNITYSNQRYKYYRSTTLRRQKHCNLQFVVCNDLSHTQLNTTEILLKDIN